MFKNRIRDYQKWGTNKNKKRSTSQDITTLVCDSYLLMLILEEKKNNKICMLRELKLMKKFVSKFLFSCLCFFLGVVLFSSRFRKLPKIRFYFQVNTMRSELTFVVTIVLIKKFNKSDVSFIHVDLLIY